MSGPKALRLCGAVAWMEAKAAFETTASDAQTREMTADPAD
jgi:hypothetical protein